MCQITQDKTSQEVKTEQYKQPKWFQRARKAALQLKNQT
jgi:hypothetical protein